MRAYNLLALLMLSRLFGGETFLEVRLSQYQSVDRALTHINADQPKDMVKALDCTVWFVQIRAMNDLTRHGMPLTLLDRFRVCAVEGNRGKADMVLDEVKKWVHSVDFNYEHYARLLDRDNELVVRNARRILKSVVDSTVLNDVSAEEKKAKAFEVAIEQAKLADKVGRFVRQSGLGRPTSNDLVSHLQWEAVEDPTFTEDNAKQSIDVLFGYLYSDPLADNMTLSIVEIVKLFNEEEMLQDGLSTLLKSVFKASTDIERKKIRDELFKWYENNQMYFYFHPEQKRFYIDREARRAKESTRDFRAHNPWTQGSGPFSKFKKNEVEK